MARQTESRHNRKRKHNHVTVVVVPNADRAVRSWRLSIPFVYVAGIIGAAIVTLTIVLGMWSASLRDHIDHLETSTARLQQERDTLKAQYQLQEARLMEVAEAAETLSGRLDALENLGDELRTKVGDPLDEDEAVSHQDSADEAGEGAGGGVGGGELGIDTLFQWVGDRLARLDKQISGRDQAFEQLQESVDTYTTRLLHTPSIWPLEGRISSPYGVRKHPLTGNSQLHAGMDIAVPAGTPVHATAHGRVTHAGPNGGYGILVVIDHGFGLSTWYAHNSGIRVDVGDEVQRGDVIALSGNTGVSTGPHLHYEVRQGGEPVDPRKFLP